MIYINTDAFSHGQVLSKIWLCEELEPHVPNKANVAILGSWYNLLAFMMLTRNNTLYSHITGIDKDHLAIEVSDKICNAWTFGEENKIVNTINDVNDLDYVEYNLVINCSVEHMSDGWFDEIPDGTTVCIQSSNVTDAMFPWYVINANKTIDILKSKYPLSSTLFSGEKEFIYGDWGYKRFMIIGIK